MTMSGLKWVSNLQDWFQSGDVETRTSHFCRLSVEVQINMLHVNLSLSLPLVEYVRSRGNDAGATRILVAVFI